jgi:hypothetical protein
MYIVVCPLRESACLVTACNIKKQIKNTFALGTVSDQSCLFIDFNNFFEYVRWDFGYCGHYWPTVPAPDDRWGWLRRNWWNKDWQGKPKYSEKTCPSATLSATNPTRLYLGLNPGRHGGKPATNRLRILIKLPKNNYTSASLPMA